MHREVVNGRGPFMDPLARATPRGFWESKKPADLSKAVETLLPDEDQLIHAIKTLEVALKYNSDAGDTNTDLQALNQGSGPPAKASKPG